MLLHSLHSDKLDAGCDEAGRGCLAGPVFAAAVILPAGFSHAMLNDSKQLNEEQRNELRIVIEQSALAYAVGSCDHEEIDEINILNASIKAMHKALEQLKAVPDHISVDGNRFKKFGKIPHTTVIKGDGKYMNIAAASILAKTYRDEYMAGLHLKFPVYGWNTNKGYATEYHVQAIKETGRCTYHRKSFILKSEIQPSLFG